MSNVAIVIPAHNEADNICEVVTAVKVFTGGQVIVVDDGSTDETAREAHEAGADVIVNPQSQGIGRSIKRGIDFALCDVEVKHVITMDAGGSHRAVDAYNIWLLALATGVNLVMGCRRRHADNTASRRRRLLSWVARQVYSYKLGHTLVDPSSGLRCYDANAARALLHIALPEHPVLHEWQYMSLHTMLTYGCTYLEAPITYERGSGSSLRLRTIWRALREVMR